MDLLGCIQSTQTGGLLDNDTSPYDVSESWSSLVDEDEGSYLPNCQSNLSLMH